MVTNFFRRRETTLKRVEVSAPNAAPRTFTDNDLRLLRE